MTGLTVGRVRGARRGEAAHRPGFGDALLEDLPVDGLAVREHHPRVHRLVALSERRVDLHLAEERVHAEGARLVGDDRDDPVADARIAEQVAQQAGEHHGCRRRARPTAGEELRVRRVTGQVERLGAHHPARQQPTKRAAAHEQVLDLVGVRARMVVGGLGLGESLVGDGQLEQVAERAQLRLADLLDLVGRVASFEPDAEGPSLDGVREDHRRRSVLFERELVRGVHLAIVVTTAAEVAKIVVGQVLDHLAQTRIGAEEMLADVCPTFCRVLLKLAIRDAVHLVDEHAVHVAREQLVPLSRPDHLDDVPAGARGRFPRAPG